MSRFKLTPLAARDLEEIWDYIAADSVGHADRMLQRFQDALEKLADFPYMGMEHPSIENELIRVWPVRKYVIVYRPDQNPIQVLRVLSGSRDLTQLFS